MGLGNDMKAVFERLLGVEIAKQLDSFDDPEKYPHDFYEECEHFMAEMIGNEAAKEKLKAIKEKYIGNKNSVTIGSKLSKSVRSGAMAITFGGLYAFRIL